VGSWITGSGTSSTLTERFPCQVSAFTIRLPVVLPSIRAGAHSSTVSASAEKSKQAD
jgi:hypothetical protein